MNSTKNQLSCTPKSIIGSLQKEIEPCTKWTALVTPLFLEVFIISKKRRKLSSIPFGSCLSVAVNGPE
jgi:hypothetical protein